MKRFIVLFVATVLVASLVPTFAYAETTETVASVVEATEAVAADEEELGTPPLETTSEPVSVWVNIEGYYLGTSSDGAATWCFILSSLPADVLSTQMTATFEVAGEVTAEAYATDSDGTQYFAIELPAGDTLLAAHANVMLPEVVEGITLSLGDVVLANPPSDEETVVPPADEETSVVDPVVDESSTTGGNQEYLPFTGSNSKSSIWMLTIAALSAAIGFALRYRAVKAAMA